MWTTIMLLKVLEVFYAFNVMLRLVIYKTTQGFLNKLPNTLKIH